MSAKNTVWFGIVVALAIGAMTWLASDSPDWPYISLAAGVPIVGFLAVFSSPRARDFIAANRWPFVAGGVATVLLSFGGVIAAALLDPRSMEGAHGKIATFVAVGGSIAGIFLATLPGSVVRYKTTAVPLPIAPAAQATFSGVSLGLSALWTPVADAGAFAVTAVPWAVIVGVVPWLLLVPIYASRSDGSRDAAPLLLAAAVASIVVTTYLALPMLLIAWYRRAAEGRFPRGPLVVPDRRYWALAHIMFIAGVFLGVLWRVAASRSQQIASFLQQAGVDERWLPPIAFLAIVLLFSQQALVLPAIAAGNRQFGMIHSIRAIRPHWLDFASGAAIAAGPYLAAIWLLDAQPSSDDLSSVIGQGFARALLLFAATASLSTYLTRIYLVVTRGENAAVP